MNEGLFIESIGRTHFISIYTSGGTSKYYPLSLRRVESHINETAKSSHCVHTLTHPLQKSTLFYSILIEHTASAVYGAHPIRIGNDESLLLMVGFWVCVCVIGSVCMRLSVWMGGDVWWCLMMTPNGSQWLPTTGSACAAPPTLISAR